MAHKNVIDPRIGDAKVCLMQILFIAFISINSD